MKKNYVIVFDMDETLGSFGQLYQFWNLTKIYLKNEDLDKKFFFNLVDNFPLFFRPNIFKLLNFVKNKKIKKNCDYVMIYTNNNGPNSWVNIIKDYIHYKLNYDLFDKIIRAFEIKETRVEFCRTSQEKSYKDFISCTKLPNNTQVCFLDDVYHKPMENKNVNYIKLKPYKYNINFNSLVTNFYNKNKKLFKYSEKKYLNFINKNTKRFLLKEKSKFEESNDLIYTEELIKKIDNFLKLNKNKTIKKKHKVKNKTNKKK